MYKLTLQWKEFNVDLRALDAQLRQDYASYVGNQAHNVLELWFSEEPSEQEKADIQAYWDGLVDQSAEAQSYQSAADIEADRVAKAASGRAKLIALGLTEEEADALLG